MSDTQRLPNLYQLLGLDDLESNSQKISAALKRAEAKRVAFNADPARATDAARLQKVIALGQKYLLSVNLKSSYDAQWTASYGSKSAVAAPVSTGTVNTGTPNSVSGSSSAGDVAAMEASWDMDALDALLPAADPYAPFQMADYLRSSEVRDPMAAEADLRKLITLLGGEVSADAAPSVSETIDLQQLANSEATGEARGGVISGVTTEDARQYESASSAAIDTGLNIPRSGNVAVTAGLAKRMRQKKQRAILFGGALLAAGVGSLVLLSLYLNGPVKRANEPVAQGPVVAREPLPTVKPSAATAGQANSTNKPAVTPNSTSLIQPGQDVPRLEIQATPLPPPDAMPMADKSAPGPMTPAPAEPTKPTTPDPATPTNATPANTPTPTPVTPATPDPITPTPTSTPTTPTPTPAEPGKTDAMKPAEPAEPPAVVKLTDKEKKVWQDDMKRIRTGLANLDPAASEKQIEGLKPLAKTAAQQSQLAILEQAVGLIRKAREALVAGIGGLESAQTFTVGKSAEVAFVEGDETRIIVRVSGRRQEYKLAAIPAKMGVTIMKMKPNVVDANLDAAIGAYLMVQVKKNSAATAEGKEHLEGAAAAGAISKELSLFYEEDYKLP